jgi:bifunctional DNA-binding transcriptional regulator/antitoxin component of YhaV-PrlF toxin-antitoxin module
MEFFVARVLREDRITIPKSVVELLGLKYGDFVKVGVEKYEKEEFKAKA